MKPLDFLIIGAQKCATTTLFEHLRTHPKINMPIEKEVPFFTGENYREDAWPDYAERYLGPVDGRLWGKVSPQYLSDYCAASRIKALMPKTKLVVILRDPLNRTWSHYQMARRRETEGRDFDVATSELLRDEALALARRLPVPTHAKGYESEGDFYIAWSEYGRMLQRYVDQFGAGQVLVLYTEDLRADAAGTLDRLLQFIGLKQGYRPDTLGQVIHQGGGSNRVPHTFRVWLRQRQLVYRLWHLLPESRRGRLRFLYEQWNVRSEPTSGRQMSQYAEQALLRHFADDLRELAALPVDMPPWLGRYTLD